MNTNKIERAAVRAVEEYIDNCPLLEPYITSNDKTPIWDGDIFIYKNNESHSVKNFLSRVPLQIKGTIDIENDSFRIGREYIEGFKADRGCAFFLVKEENKSSHILYNLLSLNDINNLLRENTKTINIPLKNIPADHIIFEQELKTFAIKRNKDKIETTSPKDIAPLVDDFNKIKSHLVTIKNRTVKYDLESIIDSIENLNTEETTEWRDRFIYYSQKAIELSSQNIKEYDSLNIQLNFGVYLLNQNLFHLAEKYFIKSLEDINKIEENKRGSQTILCFARLHNNLGSLYHNLHHFNKAEEEFMIGLTELKVKFSKDMETFGYDFAIIHNNLGLLYSDLHRYDEAEKEYKNALNICDKSGSLFKRTTASILVNLANLHNRYNKSILAEKEYNEALSIFQELDDNTDCWGDLAMIHNNLAVLYDTNNKQEAEKEYDEAIAIYRLLAKDNPNAYLKELALCLNGRAIYSKRNYKFTDADKDFNEALKIWQDLSQKYPDAYLKYEADTRNNLANLHSMTQGVETEKEYNDVLNIYRELAFSYPEAYNCYVIGTLCNLVLFYTAHNQYDCAKNKIKEILEVYSSMPDSIPDSDIIRMIKVLHDSAIIHFYQNQYIEAEQEFQEVLIICKSLVSEKSDEYSYYGITTLCNLANIHLSQKKLDEVDKEMKEALDLYWNHPYSIPKDLLLFMIYILRNLYELYSEQRIYDEAEIIITAILEIYQSLHKQEPDIFGEYIGISYLLLAISQNDGHKYYEAKQSCEEAIRILSSLERQRSTELNNYIVKARDLIEDIRSQII